MRVTLPVPSTVRGITLYDIGAFVAVDGRPGAFSDKQMIRP